MDWVEISKSAAGFLKKYSYVFLILGIGIVLMLLPGGQKESTENKTVQTETQPRQTTQESLEAILSQVHGAGKVKVLLTVAEGELTVYEKDEDSILNTDSSSIKVETVVITDANRAQQALIQQVNPPVYLGAVIVCQGADSAAVRLAVTEAVAAATGLTTDKISVLKMK